MLEKIVNYECSFKVGGRKDMKRKKCISFFVGIVAVLFSGMCVSAQTLRMVEYDMATGMEKVVEIPIVENVNTEESYTSSTLQMRSVIGSDERTPVDDTTAFPMSAVGQLKYKKNDKSYSATGWMFSMNCLATNAHVVKDSRDMFFTPGRNYVLSPFGTAKVLKTCYPEEYDNNEGVDFDFGFALLDTNIGSKTGFLNYYTNGATKEELVDCLGYPGDRTLNGKPLQMVSSGALLGKEDYTLRTIHHTVDTEAGSSGSPLFTYDSGGNPLVLAIHSEGWNINKAVSIDKFVAGAMNTFKNS